MTPLDVLTEQVRTLYRQTAAVLLANCMCALIMSALLWSSASQQMVAAWLAAMLLVSAARWAVARRYRREEDPARDPRRWGTRFVLGSLAAGSLWGLAGFGFIETAAAPAQLVILFFIGGMCSGAAGTLAPHMPAFAAFVAPALAAPALRIALVGDALNTGVAAAIVVYGAALFAVAKTNQRAFAESLALRFENEGLLTTLSRTQRSLEDANRTLERRVAERSEALRKQSEALRDAQRLEAIGRLAGGVAHDFNNLLTVILANISEIIDHEGLPPRTRAALREMRDAGSRGADLVRQLLTFSRQQRSVPETLDLNRTLGNMDRLLSRLLGDGLTLRFALKAAPVFVHMDPTQMEQVVINMVANARDAMKPGGVATIETDTVELDVRWEGLAPGSYAVLSVSDTGAGMDAETQRHIFEPFFTTKRLGKGTGLGLSTVYGIVERGGGHIDVVSQPGQGTCFRVYLPLAQAPEGFITDAHDARTVSGFRKIPEAARALTVLLVEDEPTVRSVTRRILERAGHCVLTAPDAEHALAIASERGDAIDLLISDVMMAGMSGRALATRLRAEYPSLKTLFISGYNQEHLLDDAEPHLVSFLPKPFAHDTLLAKVSELLSATERSRRAAPNGE